MKLSIELAELVMDDLRGRRGILDDIDDVVQGEMLHELAAKLEARLTTLPPVSAGPFRS